MAKKIRVCKEDGYIITEDLKECPICSSNKLVDKYKGVAVIFNSKESEVAKKLDSKSNGMFALKF